MVESKLPDARNKKDANNDIRSIYGDYCVQFFKEIFRLQNSKLLLSETWAIEADEYCLLGRYLSLARVIGGTEGTGSVPELGTRDIVVATSSN